MQFTDLFTVPNVIALPDNGFGPRGSTVTIDLLANDRNPDGSTTNLIVTSITTPTFGTVTLRVDNRTVDFVVPADATLDAIATFEYTALNTVTDLSATGSVSIRVSGGTVVCVDDTAEIAAGDPPLTITVLGNDTPADGIEIISKTALSSAVGTLAIASDGLSLLYTPPATLASAVSLTSDYTAQRIGGSSSDVGRLTINVRPGDTPGVDAYNWIYDIPELATFRSFIQANPSRLKIWNVPGDPPAHNPGDILLAIPTVSSITVGITANKNTNPLHGPVIMAGLTLRPRGTLAASYSAAVLGLGQLFSLNWAADAVCPYEYTVDGNTVTWPWLIMANIDVNYQFNSCAFGDFVTITNAGRQSNDPTTKLIRGDRTVVYYNKINMTAGPHYVSSTTNPDQNGHSDGIQSKGGLGVFRAAECHFSWCGGQLFFYGRESGDLGFSRQTRWRANKVILDHTVPWHPSVTGHGLNTHPMFFQSYENQAGANGENSDYATGKYLSKVFEGTKSIIRSSFDVNSSQAGTFVGPGEGKTYNTSTGLYTFSTDVMPTHQYPHYEGNNLLQYIKRSTALPYVAVQASQCGYANRFTSASDFRVRKLGLAS